MSNSAIQVLNQKIISCNDCKLSCSGSKGVKGDGCTSPTFLIIGEAPGQTEDEVGLPFVGVSGQLLKQCMKEAGMNSKNTYITNVVKHRPPNNRDPEHDEKEICVKRFLQKEIELLLPNMIVTTGRISTGVMLGLCGLKIPKRSLRGLRFTYNQTPVLSTWHPAYITRFMDRKPQLIEDLRLAYAFATSGVKPEPKPVETTTDELFGEANVIYG